MTTQQRTFKKPQMEKMPTLVCVGQVNTIGPAYVKDTGVIVVPMIINAHGAGKDARIWPWYRSDWFSFEFDPDTLSSGSLKGYNQNLVDKKGLSVLQAIAGSEDTFAEICELLAELAETCDPTSQPDEFAQRLTDILGVCKGNQIGYVMTQKLEDGKRTQFYEVSQYFYATDKNMEAQKKFAEKRAEKISKAWEKIKAGEQGVKVPTAYKVTFDNDSIPF